MGSGISVISGSRRNAHKLEILEASGLGLKAERESKCRGVRQCSAAIVGYLTLKSVPWGDNGYDNKYKHWQNNVRLDFQLYADILLGIPECLSIARIAP